jgi:hypothetical protein
MHRQSFTGSRPDHERRQEMVALRAQDFSLAAISRCLHCSSQSVHILLSRSRKFTAPWARTAKRAGLRFPRLELKPSNHRMFCLGRLPGTTLGQRLKAFRVAARLTQPELAEQIGLRMQTLACARGQSFCRKITDPCGGQRCREPVSAADIAEEHS